jgi:hypothetical protein
MQDVCGSLRIPATYLTHQMDRLAAAQHFRERNYGPPPKPIEELVYELVYKTGIMQDKDQFTK